MWMLKGFVFFLILVFSVACIGGEDCRLACDGNSILPIVISSQASAQTKAVAAELSEYLKRITGATFEVETGDGSSGIVLGTLKEFPNPALEKALEIRDTYDGREAFAIRTEAKRVLLIGTTDLAVSHASFRLLETIGYRHFFQARNWEVVPSLPVLVINHDENSRPVILSRRIWYGGGAFYDKVKPSEGWRDAIDTAAWSRHNRMGESLALAGIGHSWESIIKRNKAEFDAHQEYLALIDGKRQWPMLCVSNPGLRQLVIKDRLNALRENPSLDAVSVDPADSNKHCQCEQCAKLGGISDRVFGLANEVAKAVQKEFPGKLVGLLAYSAHSDPPSFSLEPNIALMLTNGFNEGKLSFDELVPAWKSKCQRMGYYDYWSVFAFDKSLPPFLGPQYARKQIPFYVCNNGIAISAESTSAWGSRGLLYYVGSKLMWDPKADVYAILADFFDNAFGPAATPMRRFYECLDKDNSWLSDNSYGLAYRDLDEASRLAQNHPDIITRIDDLKSYLHYIQLYMRWNSLTPGSAERKAAFIAMFTHMFRTRYAYMESWRCIQGREGDKAAKEFNEPTWTLFNYSQGARPWELIDEPYSHEYIEGIFQAELKEFPVVKVEEIKFSNNLVPVRFPKTLISSVYSPDGRYAFYSISGEPLEITVNTPPQNPDPRGREPSVSYVLTNSLEEKISEGTVLYQSGGRKLVLPVPKPGVYFFKSVPNRLAITGNWNLSVAAGKHAVLDLNFPNRLIERNFVFYVPKGTKDVQFFWNHDSPGSISVRDADGKTVSTFTSTYPIGRLISIPVSVGQDGRLWSFPFIAGKLHFFNIPNYLSYSAGACMIPREIAEKDQLELVNP